MISTEDGVQLLTENSVGLMIETPDAGIGIPIIAIAAATAARAG